MIYLNWGCNLLKKKKWFSMGSICLYFTFPRTSSMSIINWVCSILTVVSFASILIDKKKTSVCCWWINYELFENEVKAVDVFKDFILQFNRDKLVCYDYFLQLSLIHSWVVVSSIQQRLICEEKYSQLWDSHVPLD